jgi:hypothetical protein
MIAPPLQDPVEAEASSSKSEASFASHQSSKGLAFCVLGGVPGELSDACERRQKRAIEARVSIAIEKALLRAGFAH